MAIVKVCGHRKIVPKCTFLIAAGECMLKTTCVYQKLLEIPPVTPLKIGEVLELGTEVPKCNCESKAATMFKALRDGHTIKGIPIKNSRHRDEFLSWICPAHGYKRL